MADREGEQRSWREAVAGFKMFEGKLAQRSATGQNPTMEYKSHAAIIQDVLESPQWTNGRAGILTPGRQLVVELLRNEDSFWVSPYYTINEQQAFDIFYAFLAMRELFHSQHPEAGHARAANASAALSSGPAGSPDESAVIVREDVRRVACFVCEFDAVEAQTDRFMALLDPDEDGRITLRDFLFFFQTECDKRQLRLIERWFFVFDEPSSSRASFWMAMFIMTLIVISSLGFILATEPVFWLSEPSAPAGSSGSVDDEDMRQPPEPLPFFFYLEAACIAIFTLEYLCRLVTVWGVREELRSNCIAIPLLQAKWRTPAEERADQDPLEDIASLVLARRAQSGLPALEIDSPTPKGPKSNNFERAHLKRLRLLQKRSEEQDQGLTPKLRRTFQYVTGLMNVVDLVAIVPFYAGLVAGDGGGLAVLRVLRLARIFRIFKVGKYNEGITMLSNTIVKSLAALQLIGFFCGIGIVLFGCLIYYTEKGEWHRPYSCEGLIGEECPGGMYLRPDGLGTGKEKTPFSSIPRSFWFVIVTSTTTGFGDLSPTTDAGKVICTVIMVSSLLVLALPITIIGNNFAEEFSMLREKKELEARERDRERARQVEDMGGEVNPRVSGIFGALNRALSTSPRTSAKFASSPSSSRHNSSPGGHHASAGEGAGGSFEFIALDRPASPAEFKGVPRTGKRARQPRMASGAGSSPHSHRALGASLVERAMNDELGVAHERAVYHQRRSERLQQGLGGPFDGAASSVTPPAGRGVVTSAKYLFNARASALTWVGVDLIENQAGKPDWHGGVLSVSEAGEEAGEEAGSQKPEEGLPRALTPLLDAAQRLLDLAIQLHQADKFAAAQAIGVAREVQGLVREVLRSATTAKNKAAVSEPMDPASPTAVPPTGLPSVGEATDKFMEACSVWLSRFDAPPMRGRDGGKSRRQVLDYLDERKLRMSVMGFAVEAAEF